LVSLAILAAAYVLNDNCPALMHELRRAYGSRALRNFFYLVASIHDALALLLGAVSLVLLFDEPDRRRVRESCVGLCVALVSFGLYLLPNPPNGSAASHSAHAAARQVAWNHRTSTLFLPHPFFDPPQATKPGEKFCHRRRSRTRDRNARLVAKASPGPAATAEMGATAFAMCLPNLMDAAERIPAVAEQDPYLNRRARSGGATLRVVRRVRGRGQQVPVGRVS
jgi:hypothetical protein